MQRLARFASLPAFLLGSASLAFGGVLVVGPPGSGAAFNDVQPAIDAAQPGDTVLVLAGTYGTAAVSKPIRLVGAGSGLVTLAGLADAPVLDVGGIPAGEAVIVTGLGLVATQPPPPPFLQHEDVVRVAGNDGTVVLQDLVILPKPASETFQAGTLAIEGSALVLVEACTLIGADGGFLATPAPGIEVLDSTVWVTNSVVRGGVEPLGPGAGGILGTGSTIYVAASDVRGADGGIPFGCGLNGGDGISISGGLLKAVGPGGVIAGGDAPLTTSTFACGPFAGRGGAGIRLEGGAQAIVADALDVQGGLHDQVLFQGSEDAVVEVPGTTLIPSTFLYPTLASSRATIAGGGVVSLTVHGNPSSVAFVFLGLKLAQPMLVSGVDGATVLPSTATLLAPIPLDGLGAGQLQFAVPPLPALAGAVGLFQAVETAAPQTALSNPVLVTISG